MGFFLAPVREVACHSYNRIATVLCVRRRRNLSQTGSPIHGPTAAEHRPNPMMMLALGELSRTHPDYFVGPDAGRRNYFSAIRDRGVIRAVFRGPARRLKPSTFAAARSLKARSVTDTGEAVRRLSSGDIL